jgi:hypothetical protein
VPMRLALDRSSAAQQTYQRELAVVTHACRKLTISLIDRVCHLLHGDWQLVLFFKPLDITLTSTEV